MSVSAFAKKILHRKPSNIQTNNNSAKLGNQNSGDSCLAQGTKKLRCTLLVVGSQNVGKTALVVRFLTKRFLPEYDGGADKIYTRTVNIEEKMLNLTVIDKTGKNILDNVTTWSDLEQVDGMIVVFSCDDSPSFDACLDLLDYFKFDCKQTLSTPTLVLGNKTDLSHLRKISTIEAERCVLKYPGCVYEECSAAHNDDNVDTIIRSFIKQTLVKSDKREIKSNGRKSSIGALGSPTMIRAHFKRRFSMFGRDRTGSN